MRPKHITYTIVAAAATAVCLTQTKGAAGALLVNGLLAVGGIATFPIARHVKIAAVADEHLVTFTISGKDRFGTTITEDIIGPAAGLAVSTTKNFKIVTGVSINAALTGNVTVGTGDSLETAWIPVDPRCDTVDMGYTVSSGGNMTVAAQTTMGDVFNVAEESLPIDGALGTAIGMKAATAIRLKVTAHVSGNVSMDVLSRRA